LVDELWSGREMDLESVIRSIAMLTT
jgi:hypothetical protein